MRKPEGLGAPPTAGRGNKIGVLGRAGTGKTELVMSGCHKDKGGKKGLIFDTEGRTQYLSIGRGENLNPAPIRYPVEGIPILVVVVANEEARPLAERGCLPQLLGHPVITWTSCHPEMHQATRLQLHDNEDKDSAEEEVIGLQEIAGPDILGMVAHKGRPGLLGR